MTLDNQSINYYTWSYIDLQLYNEFSIKKNKTRNTVKLKNFIKSVKDGSFSRACTSPKTLMFFELSFIIGILSYLYFLDVL